MESVDALAKVIARHCRTDGTWETDLPGVALVRSTQPTTPVHAVNRPSICLVAQGRKEIAVGQRVLTYDRTSLLVVPVELPLVGRVVEASPSEPYLCLRVDLDAEVMAELLAAGAAAPPASCEAGPTLVGLTASLGDACLRLATCLDRPQDASWLAPLIRREVHGHVLVGEAGGLARQVAAGTGPAARVGRVMAWIRAHLDEPLSVDELARVAGMSRSALHRHFQAVTGLGPMQYQKRMRLLEARRLMVANGRQADVAAYAVGYGSATQFSRDYSRMFGTPPARDAKSLRAGLTVAAE
jgi:AraC-like DNA-binding protein